MTGEEAQAEYNLAYRMLQPGLDTTNGLKWETRYTAAYQRLVALGLQPQLRRKYR